MDAITATLARACSSTSLRGLEQIAAAIGMVHGNQKD
jgi:fructose/tagatose bisphosphate aldolase